MLQSCGTFSERQAASSNDICSAPLVSPFENFHELSNDWVIRGDEFCAKTFEQNIRRKKRIETSPQPLSEGEGTNLKRKPVKFLIFINKMILLFNLIFLDFPTKASPQPLSEGEGTNLKRDAPTLLFFLSKIIYFNFLIALVALCRWSRLKFYLFHQC